MGTRMNWELWLVFVATEGLLCVTPGPAVLMVIAQGLTRGVPAGLSATLGVLAGNSFYFALSATSLGATSVVLEFLALLAYSMAASRCRVVVARSQFARLADRIAGSCMICAGLLTAAIRRS